MCRVRKWTSVNSPEVASGIETSRAGSLGYDGGRRKDGKPLFPFGLFLLWETMLDLVATQPGSTFTLSLTPSTAAMPVPSATATRVGGGVGVGEEVLLPPKNQPSHDFGAGSG